MLNETTPALQFVQLKIISQLYPRATSTAPRGRGDNKFVDVFVPLSPIDQQPFVIGTGGFASVFLAFEKEHTQGKPLAVKLLKKELGTGSPNGRYRFIEEIFYNQKLSVRGGSTFVDYLGFGYLGTAASPSSLKVEEKEKEWVLGGLDPSDLKAVHDANHQPAMSAEFLKDHQDLFFVMAAAWCSLEQLLVSNQPLHQSNTLNLNYREPSRELSSASSQNEVAHRNGGAPKSWTRNTAFGANHEDLKHDQTRLKHVAYVTKELGVSDTSSGLEILSRIRMHSDWGPPVATRMLLQILGSLVNAVSRIHRFQETDEEGKKSETVVQLAHRDLKPANFLISECESQNPAILLADLGFIAAQRDGRTAHHVFGDVREPGALAQGTVMYQAPEQMLSGREVSFELINAAAYARHQSVQKRRALAEPQPASAAEPRRAFTKSDTPLVDGKYLPNAIRVRTVGGIQLEQEDYIISSEIQFQHGGDGGRMLICAIDQDPMYPTSVIAFIAQQIKPDQTTRAEYKGTLVKPVGQHSDLFSLGCHAYFMASGGKDPGEFYRTYLRPGSGLIHLDKNAPRDDCLKIATFLAERNGARAMIREVQALAAALRGNPYLEFIRSAVAGVSSVETDRDHFLFSTDGQPIGIIFLYIIVTLMCRDAKGSYVCGGPSADLAESASWKLRSLTDLDEFMNEVAQALVAQFAVLTADPFQKSWGGGLNALVKIRLLAPSIDEERV